ncbi:MAG: alkaline phosphatase D family protein [Cytophagales bacterium]|nr:alkaline phosphatase D family protein [Cytophagales bacterium]
MKSVFILIFTLYFPILSVCQSPVQSGPMVGYADMREALLWIQTTKASKVKFTYYETTLPGTKYSTDEIMTTKNNAYIAKLVADQVLPGKKYTYEAIINGKKATFNYPLTFQTLPLWQYRTDPPTFKLAMGSCAYINEERFDRPGKTPYGGEYEIYKAIYDKKPDLMLWLGDNTYLREADWNTRTGTIHRYTHSRSLPEMQPLLASCSHYAIWDDHDYGPNDSDRSFAYKNTTQEIFNMFWGNPNTNMTGKGGITGMFTWVDIDVFLVDDRWFRSPNEKKTLPRDYLGQDQLTWLIDALRNSKAPFKLVACGGQVINPAKIYENYAQYSEERDQLIKALQDNDIKGVIFLSGDRHHTEITKMERPGTYPLYDFTISPLNSSGRADIDEGNTMHVQGTIVGERNFAIFEVSGTRKERKLTVKVYNSKGDEKWTKEIKADELK